MGHAKRKPADEREEDAARMREWLPPGATVYTSCDHVSRSGMHRRINVHAIVGGEMMWLTGYAANVVGFTRDKKHDGLRIGGCGMDMGFHVVSTLSRVLYPDGFGCIGEGCPSNDHANGDRDYTPHAEAKARRCKNHPPQHPAVGPDGVKECAACQRTGGTAAYVPRFNRNTWSAFWLCTACAPKWDEEKPWLSDTPAECRTCDGSGRLPAGHWHRSGDYALRHRWL